jgi:hypothetical protein
VERLLFSRNQERVSAVTLAAIPAIERQLVRRTMLSVMSEAGEHGLRNY